MQQDQNNGMVGAVGDAIGFGVRGQLEWTKWQLFHMPSTWRRATSLGPEYGFNYRGVWGGGKLSGMLESGFSRLTGGAAGTTRSVPFVSQILRGTTSVPNMSAVNFGAMNNVSELLFNSKMGAMHKSGMPGLLRVPHHTEFSGPFRNFAGKAGEALFNSQGYARRGQYLRSVKEIFTGDAGKRVVRQHFGTSATDEMIAAGSQMYRGGATRKLLGGLGRIMYPVTIGMNFALVASLAYQTGKFAGEGLMALTNKLSNQNMLDFGDGMYAAAQTSASVTERQRAMQAIQRNNLNARRAIGAEAALMHN